MFSPTLISSLLHSAWGGDNKFGGAVYGTMADVVSAVKSAHKPIGGWPSLPVIGWTTNSSTCVSLGIDQAETWEAQPGILFWKRIPWNELRDLLVQRGDVPGEEELLDLAPTVQEDASGGAISDDQVCWNELALAAAAGKGKVVFALVEHGEF